MKGFDNMAVKCTVLIQKEEHWYVATDILTGVASQGKTPEESMENLKEALCLYYEDNTPNENQPNFYITTMEVIL